MGIRFADVWPIIETVLAPIMVIAGVAGGIMIIGGVTWFGVVLVFERLGEVLRGER